MSHAANPNKPKKTVEESAAVQALRQQKQERERIRRIIITLGDDSKKIVGQIKGVVGALEDDVEPHGELIRQTVLDCAQHLPFKTGILANWVTRMFEKHPEWSTSVVYKAMEEFRAAVRAGKYLPAQLLLRFLVGLGNTGLVSLTDVLQLLQEVLALSQGLRPSKGGDLGVFLALAALPFLSPTAYSQISEKIEALIATAETYLSARDARWKSLLRVVKTETPMDRLEAVMSILKPLKVAEWNAESVFHLKGLEPSLNPKDGAPQLTPLGVTADDVKKSKVRLQVPLVSSRLLSARMEADGSDTLPEHDRWLVEDYVVATIEAFARDVEECSKQLLRFPFMHALFDAVVIETVFSQMLRLPSPPFLPLFYSRLLQALVDKESALLELVNKGFYTLFDAIPDLDEECFEILAEAWSYHLLNQSYKCDWERFKRDIVDKQTERFLRRVFERLQRLSFHQNLLHRLPQHVHRFIPPEPTPASGLDAQGKPEYSKMLAFVKIKDPDEATVLEYCQRLMKISPKAEVVEDETAQPVDADKVAEGAAEEEDRPEWAEAEEENDEDDEVKRAAKRARLSEEGCEAPADGKDKEAEPESKKKRTTEVKEEVKQEDTKNGNGVKTETKDVDFGELPSEPWPIDAVAEILSLAVLQHGAKTPTHMNKILDGHQQIFLKLRPGEEEKAHTFVKAIVKSIFSFWSISGQRLEITLETMLHRGIVTPCAVVEQALGERSPQTCDSMSAWIMINSVSRKSLEGTQSLRMELAIAKKLDKEDTLESCRKQLEIAISDTAKLFTLIFTELVRAHQDWEDKDPFLRNVAVQRCLMIGRKYHAFIKPLVDSAESRIPGVAHNPDIAEVFNALRTL